MDGLADRAGRTAAGPVPVRYGAKHTDPSIEDGAADLAGAGVDRVVGLVLTPHRSSMGSGEYLDRAAAALAARPSAPPFCPVDQWYDAPGFAELLAERVVRQLATLRPEPPLDRVVLFTAHSLPERVVAAGDPYPDQVAESAGDRWLRPGRRRRVSAGGWPGRAPGAPPSRGSVPTS